MYAIESYIDVTNKANRRRTVTVTFTDGQNTFNQAFEFSPDVALTVIKKAVQQFLDEINFVPPVIDDLVPDPDPVPPDPTAEEIAKAVWLEDWKNLQAVVKLQAHGVEILSPAQVTTLKTKVQNNWINSYRDIV